MTYEIPVIDFSDFATNPVKVAEEVFRAASTIGFFYVVGHGMAQQDIDHVFELSKTFFDLPLEVKESINITETNRGYTGLYRQKLDPDNQKIGDHKEAINMGNFGAGEMPCSFPAEFEPCRPDLKAFAQKCHETAEKVMQAFAISLQIPEDEGGIDYFTMRHRYDAPSGETFRLLKYPRGGQDAYKEIVRAGSHSDYGTITLLFQKDVGGLEVHAFDREWISAPLIEGAILVNIGDLMEFWTGGLFKSTKHRVTFLPEHATKDRYSVAYFFQPERDVPITCIPCPKVNQQGSMYTVNGKIMTSIEHLQKRLEAGYGFKSGNIMATGAS